MKLDLPLAQPVQDWLKFTGSQLQTRAQGALQLQDSSGKLGFEIRFNDGLLTELRFPRCDVAERVPGRLAQTLQPERAKLLGPSRSAMPSGAGPSSPMAPWNCHQFKLDIKGLDCSRVQVLEPIVLRQDLVPHLREDGVIEFGIGKCQCGNLVLQLPLTSAKGWFEWQAKTLGAGGIDERDGLLILLGPDMKTVLGTLTLSGLGLLSLQPVAVASAPMGELRLRAEMYVQRLQIDLAPKQPPG